MVSRFFPADSCGIYLNHGDLLDAVWCWIGIKAEHRAKVAEVCIYFDILNIVSCLSWCFYLLFQCEASIVDELLEASIVWMESKVGCDKAPAFAGQGNIQKSYRLLCCLKVIDATSYLVTVSSVLLMSLKVT